ncbi:MAG: hypothetical protein PGMFKBFP_02551 [Anaerolineales bacterium]|nr:hypothetical protein [Anaerolineales bacterium]
MVVAGVEESACRVGEMRGHFIGQFQRGNIPFGVGIGLVQSQQGQRQCGVIFEVGRVVRLSVAPGALQTAFGHQVFQNEARVADGRVEIVFSLQMAPGFGESRQREGVPHGDDLVVGVRADARAADGQKPLVAIGQFGADRFEVRVEAGGEGGVVQRALEDRLPFPVSLRDDPIGGLKKFEVRAERGLELFLCPDVEPALFALRVGVEAAEESAVGMGHLPQEEVERLFADAAVVFLSRHQKAVQVGERELGVVVEHFFEVRHAPEIVHAVAREAAADDIVHAAARHGVENVRADF